MHVAWPHQTRCGKSVVFIVTIDHCRMLWGPAWASRLPKNVTSMNIFADYTNWGCVLTPINAHPINSHLGLWLHLATSIPEAEEEEEEDDVEKDDFDHLVWYFDSQCFSHQWECCLSRDEWCIVIKTYKHTILRWDFAKFFCIIVYCVSALSLHTRRKNIKNVTRCRDSRSAKSIETR